MISEESVRVKTSGILVDQNGSDDGKSVADSPTIRVEVQDEIFDMEDVGEEKATKRQRTDEEASVRIIFSSLPRSSKKKLDELLNSWSEWHSQNCSSEKDPPEPIEYGEQTYFLAIRLGVDKTSSVSLWMDSQVRKRQRTELVTLDNSSAPLYDRDYSLGLTSEAEATDEKSALDLRNASRCFNCGSYGHSLRECAKPHNQTAVSSARKEHQSKKNKNSGPRVQARYYQDSPGGKYDGLKPGCLAAETRELLGLKDLQPPPWLNRMRQLGYPPGYLDSDEKDQPSGIEIFGDEGASDDRGDEPKPNTQGPKKMTVDFPGINAPIPKNADPKAWEEEVQAPPPVSESPFPPPHLRLNHIKSPPEIWNNHGRPWSQNYSRLPPLHYNYDSPPPPSFSHPNSFHNPSPGYSSEPFSPPGVPIPRSPRDMPPHFRSGGEPFSPPGVPIPRSPAGMIPHFGSGTPPFRGDFLPHDHNHPPNSFTYQNSWHSSA